MAFWEESNKWVLVKGKLNRKQKKIEANENVVATINPLCSKLKKIGADDCFAFLGCLMGEYGSGEEKDVGSNNKPTV